MVLILWNVFKVFLHESLGKSQEFVDSIWREIRKDSLYRLEKVMDWAAHLAHLKVMLKKFDPIAAPNKDVLIR